MDPFLHLNYLCEQLREAEDRHRSTYKDYWLFVKKAQSLKRRTYLLHFKILEYRRKIMTKKQAEEDGRLIMHQALGCCEVPNSEKQAQATMSDSESSVEEECIRRNIAKAEEAISFRVQEEMVKCESLDEGPCDLVNETAGLQLVQEAGDGSDGVLSLRTNGAMLELYESPLGQKILVENGTPVNTHTSTLSSEEQIPECFPLSEINIKLPERNFSDKTFPMTSEEAEMLQKFQEKDKCSNHENKALLQEKTSYHEMKPFENMEKLADECGNESRKTEIELKERSTEVCGESSVSPPLKKNMSRNCVNSPRAGNFSDLKLGNSLSNNAVPLVPEIIVTHFPRTKSEENLPWYPKHSSAENSKNLDDEFEEVPLNDEQENKDYFDEYREKPLCFEATNSRISKGKSQELLAASFQSSELSERKGTSFSNISLQASTYSKNRGTMLMRCWKSDTNINFSCVPCCPGVPKYRSMETLKTSCEIKSSGSFGLFSLAKYNPHHFDMARIITPDYYYAVDDQQVLLPSGKPFEKKRKFFRFRWKSFPRIKRKSKFSRQSSDIFGCKNKEEVKIRGKKANLFSRIFGPLINCGFRGKNKRMANDLMEVLDPLEENE